MAPSPPASRFFFFFFNDTATTEIYTLSLHDALPISLAGHATPVGENVPEARTPSCRPVPLGPGAPVGPITGYSHMRIGPFAPGGPQWICAMITLSMFDAMRRNSTVPPSAVTRKIACPCARESAGVGSPGFAGVNTSWAPDRWVRRWLSPARATVANSGARTSNAVGSGWSATQPTSNTRAAPETTILPDIVDSAFQVLGTAFGSQRCGPRHPTPGTCFTAR